MSATTITNVRVFTGQSLSEAQTVHILDGLLAAEPTPGAEIFDARGRTLLPGLIDAHVHILRREELEAGAQWGVTTMLDMANSNPGLMRELRAVPGLPELRSALAPASAPGGMQTARMGMPASSALPGPAEAARFVAEQAEAGADYIKIIVENPERMGSAALSGETIAALVRAAHVRGLETVAHVTSTPAFELAVAAGVDVLTHAPLDAPLSEVILGRIAANRSVAVPTLTMMQGIAQSPNLPTHAAGISYANAEQSVTALHRAGIPIVAGTDANSSFGSPSQPRHGEALHHELALLVAAGLSPIEALQSATSLAAEHFHLPDRGTVAPGLRADLLLIDGDPTRDIAATRNIQAVWIGGRRVR